MAKKIVYVDMDNTIVDFKSGIKRLSKIDIKEYKDRYDDHPYIFTLMDPIKDSIESVKKLDKKYDLLIPIKYNYHKRISGKGSCIFLHLTNNYKPTAGCIALNKNDFLIMLKIINKKTKIKIN